jgi:hypothetical protein
MSFRSAIPDFQLANPLYIGARVTFYAVDENGARTTTLATLYANPTGSQQASNPQELDSEGKFQRPVYIELPVIAETSGPNVETHSTGVINPRGTYRGDWVTNTVYFSTDFIRDPVSGNIYSATNDYKSGASVSADVTAGNLVIVIDQDDVISGGASQAIKVPVLLVSTTNLPLSGLAAIDGVTPAAGDRVLAAGQTNAALNGPYNAAVGAWTRTVDADKSVKFADGCVVNVRAGTVNHGKRFQLSISTPFVLGTSFQTWVPSEFPDSVIELEASAPPDGLLTTGIKGYSAPAPFDGTINLMTMFANAPGSIVVDIYKSQFPTVPTSGSICGASPPILSGNQATRDAVLSGWTLTVNKGDVFALNIVSVSGLRFINLSLGVTRK